jgi:hypothetical protein
LDVASTLIGSGPLISFAISLAALSGYRVCPTLIASGISTSWPLFTS